MTSNYYIRRKDRLEMARYIEAMVQQLNCLQTPNPCADKLSIQLQAYLPDLLKNINIQPRFSDRKLHSMSSTLKEAQSVIIKCGVDPSKLAEVQKQEQEEETRRTEAFKQMTRRAKADRKIRERAVRQTKLFPATSSQALLFNIKHV